MQTIEPRDVYLRMNNATYGIVAFGSLTEALWQKWILSSVQLTDLNYENSKVSGIDSDHILLSILSYDETHASRILKKFGVEIDSATIVASKLGMCQ